MLVPQVSYLRMWIILLISIITYYFFSTKYTHDIYQLCSLKKEWLKCITIQKQQLQAKLFADRPKNKKPRMHNTIKNKGHTTLCSKIRFKSRKTICYSSMHQNSDLNKQYVLSYILLCLSKQITQKSLQFCILIVQLHWDNIINLLSRN